MTQHIEPVCWTSEDQIQKAQADPGHNMLIWGEPLVHHPDVALVRLSDAQAALAAAEERGRMEERERCVAVFDRLLRQLVELDRFSRSYALRLTSLAKADCAAITKEQTP